MQTRPELVEISKRGWLDAEFDLSEVYRAEYAKAANLVISLALEDEKVRQSLEFELNPGLEKGSVRTGLFGIGRSRNSADNKVYLHTGNKTRKMACAAIPWRNQPSVLRDFWDIDDTMHQNIEASTKRVVSMLGAEALLDDVFPTNKFRSDVHLRTVRYPDALSEPVGAELVEGHADLGLMTWHLYETHGGWLMGVPYPPELMTMSDSPDRRKGIQAMRGSMKLLEQTDNLIPFFLGANWHTYPQVPENMRSLPPLYHAGFRPDPQEEVISLYADDVNRGGNDRVSVIAFLHPNGDILKEGRYIPATVSQCRPEY